MIRKHLKQVSQDIIVSWVFLNPWRVKKFYEVLRTVWRCSLNHRAGRTVASTAPECMALKTPFWGRKQICHSVYQWGLRLQAKQMNFGKLKGIYSHISLLTKPKRKTGDPGSKTAQDQGATRKRAEPRSQQHKREGEGMPRSFPALRTPSLWQLLATLISSTVSLSFCIL